MSGSEKNGSMDEHSGAEDRVRRLKIPGPGARKVLASKLRKPAVGLGLLGVAAPLAGTAARSESKPAPAPRPERATRADTAGDSDVDERLAAELGAVRAASRATTERADTIRAAAARHGISETLAAKIFDAAAEEGIEPNVAYGLVRTESSFRRDVVSHAGARGLTQLMPRTAAWLQPGTTTAQLNDERTNLRLGFRYLRQLIDKYSGNMQLALTAYNRGPGTVDKVLRGGGNPDNGYAGRVLRG